MEGTQVARFDGITPELKYHERDEGDRLDFDAGRHGVVGRVRRFVKVFFRNVRPRMAIVAVIDTSPRSKRYFNATYLLTIHSTSLPQQPPGPPHLFCL